MSQRGFTLVEMLVAMTMSSLVIFGASAVIVSSLNVTKQVTGRVTALEQGRTGIEALLGQLNSGCLVNSVSPVLASTTPPTTNPVTPAISPAVSSDATHLVFTTGLGDSTNPTPTLHVVAVSSSGALLDSFYAYTGTPAQLGTPTAWTFASSPSQIQNLAQNVTAAGASPMFSYYAYQAVNGTNSLMGASALATPLTSTTAPTVAEVDLDFRFNPPGTNNNSTTTSELQDSAVFSLSADGTDNQNAPCQ